LEWNFQPDRPIYVQLMEKIKLAIASGIYPAGFKLPAVRDMATEVSVNPNTLQKALSELEREGLVYSQRTTGRYVTEDEKVIEQVRQDIVYEQILLFIKKMESLGYSKTEILTLVEAALKERN